MPRRVQGCTESVNTSLLPLSSAGSRRGQTAPWTASWTWAGSWSSKPSWVTTSDAFPSIMKTLPMMSWCSWCSVSSGESCRVTTRSLSNTRMKVSQDTEKACEGPVILWWQVYFMMVISAYFLWKWQFAVQLIIFCTHFLFTDDDLITIFDSSDLSFAIQCSRILKLTLFGKKLTHFFLWTICVFLPWRIQGCRCLVSYFSCYSSQSLEGSLAYFSTQQTSARYCPNENDLHSLLTNLFWNRCFLAPI